MNVRLLINDSPSSNSNVISNQLKKEQSPVKSISFNIDNLTSLPFSISNLNSKHNLTTNILNSKNNYHYTPVLGGSTNSNKQNSHTFIDTQNYNYTQPVQDTHNLEYIPSVQKINIPNYSPLNQESHNLIYTHPVQEIHNYNYNQSDQDSHPSNHSQTNQETYKYSQANQDFRGNNSSQAGYDIYQSTQGSDCKFSNTSSPQSNKTLFFPEVENSYIQQGENLQQSVQLDLSNSKSSEGLKTLKTPSPIQDNIDSINVDFTNQNDPQRKIPKKKAIIKDYEKIYSCHYPGCEKAFHRSYNLKSHMICHSDVKNFVCYCGVGFSRKHDLQRHKKNVHDKTRNSKIGGTVEMVVGSRLEG
ncbi:hypothetical protein HK099_007467 [Clydaea vesicula]|uniref:C2H2-type domain-containing protein n=1 Tax=Clydaea vesicula TaxID=447962 RepID=A0AAD5TYX5_9FUNG|nr:hypothetical protein HK099_007467 [Clydaea vesicula]